MGAGSESDNQKPRRRIAKAGHGLTPILLLAISAPPQYANFFAVRYKTGTQRALNDFALEAA
jgi:hypothetical protein